MRATMSEELLAMARDDDRVVFIGSDLGFGAMDDFRREFSDRFFMEGVSEQYVMGMAAGLAMEGFVPFVASIASFITRRCYEQIRIDVCLHNLPVRIVGIGAGLVYAPLGPTHTAVDDLALLREIPNLTIAAPGDRAEVRSVLRDSLSLTGPLYLRLGPAQPPTLARSSPLALGKADLLRPAVDVLIVSTGAMTHIALTAADILAERDVRAGVLHLHTICPIDEETILTAAKSTHLVVTLEEHSVVGGLGSAVCETIGAKHPSNGPLVLRLGLPREFPVGATDRDILLTDNGLNAAGVARSIVGRLSGDHRLERRTGRPESIAEPCAATQRG